MSFHIEATWAQPYANGVGINKEANPINGTLDIGNFLNSSGNTDITKVNGVLTPRLTGDQMESMLNNLTSLNHGLLVYATEITSNISNPIIVSTGFWVYDAEEAGNWVPLERADRAKSVRVRSTGSADYRTLQIAYDTEAKKKYISNKNEPIEFKCEGNVGGLIADGSIPNIKITGINGAYGATISSIKITNSIVSFDGYLKSIGNIEIIGSYAHFLSSVNGFKSKQIILKRSLADIEAILNCTQMQLFQTLVNTKKANTSITIEPTTNNTEGISLSYSCFLGLKTTSLNFSGAYTFSNYIVSDDASTMVLPGTINAQALCSGAVIISRQASNVSVGTILGTSAYTPRYVLYTLTGGRIIHAGGLINMYVSEIGFNAVTGSEIFLNGSGTSTVTNINGGTGNGGNAAGGDIKVSKNSGMYIFDQFSYALRADMGGQIYTQQKLLSGTCNNVSNIPLGNIQLYNGSVIY